MSIDRTLLGQSNLPLKSEGIGWRERFQGARERAHYIDNVVIHVSYESALGSPRGRELPIPLISRIDALNISELRRQAGWNIVPLTNNLVVDIMVDGIGRRELAGERNR